LFADLNKKFHKIEKVLFLHRAHCYENKAVSAIHDIRHSPEFQYSGAEFVDQRHCFR
jgi:hypothetical protein